MLTPTQIKNHKFSVSGKGTYTAIEVDEYINEIVASYEQMFKENGDLVKKIGMLANKIEEYKDDEDNIKEALLTAQRMADKITKEAKLAAESKLGDADDKSKNMIAVAKSEAEKVMTEAKEKAKRTLDDAEADAEKKVAEAQAEVDKQKLILEKSKEEVKKFKNEVMEMYKAHTECLQKIPEEVDQQVIDALTSKYSAKPVATYSQENEYEDISSDDTDEIKTELNSSELDEILSSDVEDDEDGDDYEEDFGNFLNNEGYDEEDDDDEAGFKVSLDDIDEDEEE
ncbi:MAG: DivIVA domain-containing protein, partial [Clostridiales bacterium]|nr:DivIVA domain-containing protein [Clostridiales bacterium]